MSGPGLTTIPEQDAVEQIVETVQHDRPGEAPFALVLGSGFSHGLVPTVREIIEESLPQRIESLAGGNGGGNKRELAQRFWNGFAKRNARRNLNLPLDPVTGLPTDYSAAYRAAFDPKYFGAVGEPAHAREFQRQMMRLERPRLNAAHFLLASMLGVQPRRTIESGLFKARAAFCRLILTTNFDPFLQIALQSVNRLYLMSDTPDLGVGDDILDDQTDAIHLVYVHGSIHRRSQAATEADIQALKEKNARILSPALKRRGVIVLGYSGWDDAIVEALAACDSFDHRLYWCGRDADPLAPGAFGPRVADILRKPSANYVKIDSAGRFMAQLHTQLVKGLPRLLDNPIGQLLEMLETIDLAEFESLAPTTHQGGPGLQPSAPSDALVTALRDAKARLHAATQGFTTSPALPVAGEPHVGPAATPPMGSAAHLLSSARAAAALSNHKESIKLLDQALAIESLETTQKAEALLDRALAHYFTGDLESAIAGWSALIDLAGAPVEYVAQAMYNRAVTWGQAGQTDKELADYTRVIEHLPGAPVEQVAQALYNRAARSGQAGETEKAVADYERVIGLPGAPRQLVAQALANRGWQRYKRSSFAEFLSDTLASLSIDPTLDYASFNLGLALLACGRDEDAMAAYRQAAERFPAEVNRLGLEDIAEAEKSWLSSDRAARVRASLTGK